MRGATIAVLAIGAMFMALALAPARARAQTLDLQQSAVIGSPRIIGMGGAVSAAAEDMTGVLATPAAMAFRPPGAVGSWDWDLYLDTLIASNDTDLTNSGLPAGPDRPIEAFAGGICLYVGKWGIGLSGAGVSYGLPPAATGAASTTLMSTGSQLAVGRAVLDGQLGIGVSIAAAEFTIKDGDTALFDMTGGSLAAGVLARPNGLPWRAALQARLPAITSAVTNDCAADPTKCNGLVPPEHGQAPWQIGAGFAWRFGQTTWNEPTPVLFRDERALVLAADVAIVGRVPDGISVAGFAAQMQQPSGRSVTASARVGAEGEILPGRLRARAGSYWEPERIEGRGGRLHGTIGAELRLFRFNFWEKERRVRLALAADLAERYQNIALSIGFWH
jgi:hypothetical protein